MLKENSLKVFNYVKEHDGEDFTAQDIANELGLGKQTVNGIVTSAFQRKGLMTRVPAEVENPDGTHDKVKFIVLTDEGRAFDPTQEDAE